MSKQDNRVGRPGEFRGDFTRDTFDPANSYSRVFMQQGRVSIDADWNEQISILHHYQRMFTTATIGPHAAPWNCESDFQIRLENENLTLQPGYYFVDGLLCHNPDVTEQVTIADLLGCSNNDLENGSHYMVYLDVWERHLTYIEDDGIREVALGGADTATRAQITWKIRGIKLPDDYEFSRGDLTADGNFSEARHDYHDFLRAIRDKIKPGNGHMQARAKPSSNNDADLCASDDSAGYRGKENQLYRVEIHRGGSADEATFKWSRDNSAVIFPVTDIAGETITLEHLGRDECRCLKVNDWVEVVNVDHDDCQPDTNKLYQITAIDMEKNQVTLNSSVVGITDSTQINKIYLRQWDHQDKSKGGTPGIEYGIALEDALEWYELEDGVEIRFDKLSESEDSLNYQPGDYWLIPARSTNNSIEWPAKDNEPAAQPALGTVHHYAPLAIFLKTESSWEYLLDCRRMIDRNWRAVSQNRLASRANTGGNQNTNPPASRSTKKAAAKTTRKKAKKRSKKKASKK